jgi:hypothetical protein
VVLLDQAGWHTSPKLKVPANITLLPAAQVAGTEPNWEKRLDRRDCRPSTVCRWMFKLG